MEMESQSLLDDSWVPATQQPPTATADDLLCPVSGSTQGSVAQRTPARLVAASDDSDTDFEDETEAAPLLPRRLKDSLFKDDEDGGSPGDACHVVDATLDDDSETDVSDSGAVPSPLPRCLPVARGPRAISADMEMKEDSACEYDSTRDVSVDLEAETQFSVGMTSLTSVDLDVETQPGEISASSRSVDLETERQSPGRGHAKGLLLDGKLPDVTRPPSERLSDANVDLDAPTQLYHGTVSPGCKMGDAGNVAQLPKAHQNLIPSASSVNLRETAHVFKPPETWSAPHADLEAATQVFTPDIDDAEAFKPPQTSNTSLADLEAATQVFTPASGNAEVFKPPKPVNASNADLEAATQVFKDVSDETKVFKSPEASNASHVDLEAATQVFTPDSDGAEVYKSPKTLNVSHADLEAATQVFTAISDETEVFRPPEALNASHADLEAATQVFIPANDDGGGGSSMDLEGDTQMYIPRRDGGLNVNGVNFDRRNTSGEIEQQITTHAVKNIGTNLAASDPGLDAGVQAHAVPGVRNFVITGVDLDAATQAYQGQSRDSLDLTNVDLDAATQAFSSPSGRTLNVIDVDVNAPTQVYGSNQNTNESCMEPATNPCFQRSADVPHENSDVATEIYKNGRESDSKSFQADKETAIHRFRGCSTAYYKDQSNDRDLEAVADLTPASRDDVKSSPKVDMEVDTELCSIYRDDGCAATDLDMNAPTQIYLPGGSGRTSVADIDMEAATQVLERNYGVADTRRTDAEKSAGKFRQGEKSSSSTPNRPSSSPKSPLMTYAESDSSDSESSGVGELTQPFELATPRPQTQHLGGLDHSDIDTDMGVTVSERPLLSEVASSGSETDVDEDLVEREQRPAVWCQQPVERLSGGASQSPPAQRHDADARADTNGVIVSDTEDTRRTVDAARDACDMHTQQRQIHRVVPETAREGEKETNEDLIQTQVRPPIACLESRRAAFDTDTDVKPSQRVPTAMPSRIPDVKPSQRVSTTMPSRTPISSTSYFSEVDTPETAPRPGCAAGEVAERQRASIQLSGSPDRLSDAVADPEDMIATQLLPAQPQTPPLTERSSSGSGLSPRRAGSSLSTESETQDDRIELPSTQEVIQVLAISKPSRERSLSVSKTQSETEVSPARYSPVPEMQPLVVRPASKTRAARVLFGDAPCRPEPDWNCESENLLDDDPRSQTRYLDSSAVTTADPAERQDGTGGDRDSCNSERAESTDRKAGTVCDDKPEQAGKDAGKVTVVQDAVLLGKHRTTEAGAGPSSAQLHTQVVISPLRTSPPAAQACPDVKSAGARDSRSKTETTLVIPAVNVAKRQSGRGRATRSTADTVSAESTVAAVSTGTAEIAEGGPIERRTSSRRVRAPNKYSPSKADTSLKRRRSAASADASRESIGPTTSNPSSKRRRAAAPVVKSDRPDRAARAAAMADRRRLATVELAGDSDMDFMIVGSSEDDDVSRTVSTPRSSPAKSVASSARSVPRRSTVLAPIPPVTRARRAAQSTDQFRPTAVARPSRGRRDVRVRRPAAADSMGKDVEIISASSHAGALSESPGRRVGRQTRSAATLSSVVPAGETVQSVAITATSRGRGSHRRQAFRKKTPPNERVGSEAPAEVSDRGVRPVRRRSSRTEVQPARRPSTRRHAETGLAGDDTGSLIAPSTISVASQASVRSVSGSGRSVVSTNHPRVLFTGYERDQADERIVTSLGGVVVERPAECTVLVTTGVKRTIKFIACFARGTPIVTPVWLTKSKQAKCFLEPWEFLVHDKTSEAKFGFRLDLNLRAASRRSRPLLSGWSVHVTPLVLPPPEQLREIIECAGGVFLSGPPRSAADRVAVISCKEDARHWAAMRRLQLPLVSAELLLSGVLHQQLDLRRHALTG